MSNFPEGVDSARHNPPARLSDADRAFLDAAMLAALPATVQLAAKASVSHLKERDTDRGELAARIAADAAHALLRVRNGDRGR